jgi:hypothetical protein
MNQNKSRQSRQSRPPLSDAAPEGARKADRAAGADAAKEHERRGWEAYRRWLSTMSSRPVSERAPLDPSLYSWKGYHNWADKVRQSWKSEES